jgi:hypothetical protein
VALGRQPLAREASFLFGPKIGMVRLVRIVLATAFFTLLAILWPAHESFGPCWLVPAMTLAVLGVLWRREHLKKRRQFRRQSGLCPSCGYDLRGTLASKTCPECGAASDVRKPSG